MTEASRWNEGKIHLGFIFANDKSGRTAQAMVEGAETFATLLERQAGFTLTENYLSDPFNYAVHRESMLSPDEVEAHFGMVRRLCEDVEARRGTYLGASLGNVFERLSKAECERFYDADHVVAAFRTVERALRPDLVADRIVEAVAARKEIAFHPNHLVDRLEEDGDKLRIVFADGTRSEPYDHVVNALWGDRLRVDASVGVTPPKPWLNRHKLAIHVRSGMPRRGPPSTTLMLGEFGDIVRFEDGAWYLSWYPICKTGQTRELVLPDFDGAVTEERRRLALSETLRQLAKIAPSIAEIADVAQDATIQGGIVFAWGSTGIMDRESDLHNRFEIGVRSRGTLHSIDTGKYGMAPLFAEHVATRIAGR